MTLRIFPGKCVSPLATVCNNSLYCQMGKTNIINSNKTDEYKVKKTRDEKRALQNTTSELQRSRVAKLCNAIR